MKLRHACCIALISILAWDFPAPAQEINEAAENGDLARVKSLVETDPQLVKTRDEQGRTPLHLACRGVHLEVLTYLVENGADVSAGDDNGVTPLHSVSYRGNTSAMKLLIGKGAAVEVMDENGMPPLIYAVYAGHQTAVELLVQSGASVKVRDHTGVTATDIALDQGHEELARYLISRGGELTPVADAEVSELAPGINRITFCYQQCTNMLVVEGSDGLLLIDTGYRRTSEKLKQELDKLGEGKKITVINTHQHYDHTGGNAIAGDGATIISLENSEQLVAGGILEKNHRARQGKPDNILDGGYTLRFNGRKIRLIPLPGTHTDGDMIVHLEDAGIVHMGDLLLSQSFPSLTRGAKIIEYMVLLQEVLNSFDQQTIFIGGHGRNLSKKELAAYRDMLQETIDIVTGGMKAGKNAATMRKDGVLREYTSYDTSIPELNTEYWIGAVYRSYEGRIDTIPGSSATAELKIESQASGPWSTNCHLLYDAVSREAALVDPGRPLDVLLARIDEEKLELKYIFITHGHQDHVAGVPELREQFPDARLCFTKDEYDDLRQYAKWRNLYSPESVEAWAQDAAIVELMSLDYSRIGKPDMYVTEEHEFRLGQLAVSALWTPGHSRGSASYVVGNAIFSGDLIYFNTVGYLEYELGSKEDAVQSVRRLYRLFPDDTVIYPGHGALSSIGHEKKFNRNVTPDRVNW